MTQAGSAKLPLKIPPLESGDRLTRAEFERRYKAMLQRKPAELIEGIVYMPSPLRAESHGQPHARIMAWLVTYEAATPGVGVFDNAAVRLDPDNEPQPDALLRMNRGGRSRISPDDYIEGAPELIVEIAASSASIDMHEKLKVYRRNQVQEYLVWRVYDQQFDWFRLEEEQYIQLEPDAWGMLRSRVFPGLWLDRPALLEGNLARVLEVLQQGLASAEHRAFIKQLRE